MSGPFPVAETIARALDPHGIAIRGIVNFEAGEGPILVDGKPALSVVLLGNIGGSIWPAFSRWRERYEGSDSLDHWSKALIRPLAKELGATAYFPSDPPWQPFQQWAMKAEGLKASPLGILIHPRYGLWHGYRGALGFPFRIDVWSKAEEHPCDACVEKLCLSSCPVQAVTLAEFDIPACRSYLAGDQGRQDCMVDGCRARNSCPVGAEFRYPAGQLTFHMDALIR